MCSHISHAALEVIYFYWRDEFARMSRLSSVLLKKCHAVFNLQRLVTGGEQALFHQVSPAAFCPLFLQVGAWSLGSTSRCGLFSPWWIFTSFLCIRLLFFCLCLRAFHLSFCLAILPHKFTYLFFSPSFWLGFPFFVMRGFYKASC